MTIHQILDTERISGKWAINRDIGPELLAYAVDSQDLDDAAEAIRTALTGWGGGANALLPIGANIDQVHPAWQTMLEATSIDSIFARDLLDASDWRSTYLGVSLEKFASSESLWAMLVAQQRDAKKMSVATGLPSAEDEWHISYLACLGDLNEDLDERAIDNAGLRPDITLGELVDLQPWPQSVGSAEDLITRLRDPRSVSFRQLSLTGLGYLQASWSQDFKSRPVWFQDGWEGQFVGSNIAIVYEPGSVSDLCLAWNLRAVHGFPPGMPLAIPKTDSLVSDLRDWSNPESEWFAGRLRGVGRPFAITSISVESDELNEIAKDAGNPWQVFAPEALSASPHRTFLRSTEVASFDLGKAKVAAFDRESSDLLRRRPPAAYGPDLHVRITVRDKPVPPLMALRNDYAFDRGWRDGGFDSPAPSLTGESIEVPWPHGWGVLQGALNGTGLSIRPSKPGSAGIALLRRLGSFRALDPLRDEWLLSKLDELAERRGISWFRKRVREIAAKAGPNDPEGLERIEQLLLQLTLVGNNEEQSDLTVSTLTKEWTNRQAKSWIEWAERSGLLVRGVNLECGNCGSKDWRSIGDFAPPVTCGGCGKTIEHPFPAGTLTFRYRASQTLLEVMEADTLPHLLCAGWWISLLGSGIYGVHPGLEFLNDEKQVVGEADVVLLLSNGRIALGECKRRANGLKQSDIDSLESIADQTNAAFTFYATPQWSSQAGPLWTDLRRDLPERRRFALFGQHLLKNSQEVNHPLGADVTIPDPHDEEAIGQSFKRYLSAEVVGDARIEGFEDWVLQNANLKYANDPGDQ